jgi:hypothetical protein
MCAFRGRPSHFLFAFHLGRQIRWLAAWSFLGLCFRSSALYCHLCRLILLLNKFRVGFLKTKVVCVSIVALMPGTPNAQMIRLAASLLRCEQMTRGFTA